MENRNWHLKGKEFKDHYSFEIINSGIKIVCEKTEYETVKKKAELIAAAPKMEILLAETIPYLKYKTRKQRLKQRRKLIEFLNENLGKDSKNEFFDLFKITCKKCSTEFLDIETGEFISVGLAQFECPSCNTINYGDEEVEFICHTDLKEGVNNGN
jgi:rubrerythrin